MPFAGVFTSYGTMVHASAGSTPGITLILVFIGLPLVAMVGSLFVALNFSTGVERGIVESTAPAAVDLQMQASVKSMGSPRQIGPKPLSRRRLSRLARRRRSRRVGSVQR